VLDDADIVPEPIDETGSRGSRPLPRPPSPPRPPVSAAPAPPQRSAAPAPALGPPHGLPHLPPLSAGEPQSLPAKLEPVVPSSQVIAPTVIDFTADATTSLRAGGATPSISPPRSVPVEPRVRAARDLLSALRHELEQHPKPLRAGRLHFESGRLYESPLGEAKEAAEAYLKAHAQLGDHLPSIRGARRTLLHLGRAQEALPLFDAELKLTADAGQKAQVLYDKAAVLEDVLGQKKEAREVLQSAAELGKGDATRIKSTERAEALARSWDTLGRALEREANSVKDDPRHRSALVAARARLLEAHRGDPSTAVELYKTAAEGDPHNSSALHSLKRLHYSHQRWSDLIGVLEREAELAADPGVRAMAYYRVGRLWLDRLGNLDEALSALERAAHESPLDPMILEELARLHELAGRHAELASVLERLAEQDDSAADRLAYCLRIGELYEHRLGNDEKAIFWYENARAVDRCYIPVLQALAELYTKRSEFEKLVVVHEGEAEGATDPVRRAAAHARIAEIYETDLGRPEQAMQHHARALGALPGYSASFKALVRLLTQAQRYPELVEIYERAVDQAADSEGKVTYLYKIGRLYEDALSSPAQAMVAYRRILEILPNEISAMHSLQRAAERAGSFKELIAALEYEAEKVPDKRRKLELVHRAGEVAENDLKDDALAINLFRRLAEIDKAYAPAYVSLGRLYFKAGRWEELIDAYKNELRLLPKGAALSALQFKMGQLYEDRLGRDEDAIGSYRRAVEADPNHRAAVRALARKLEQKGSWDDLVRLLEAELATLDEPKLRARTALRIGEVSENRLRAPEKALAAYEQALAAEPELVPARDGRIRLLTEARDYRRLVEELEREASAQRDPRLAIWALLRAGEVYRDDLGDPTRAVRAFEAVIERDPAHVEALLALEPLYAERGAWEALAGVYAAEARVLSDKSARIAALRELARLQQNGKVASADHGRQALGAILQLTPSDTGALFALERIALSEGDGELLAHVDSNLARIVSDPASVATHETRLGELLEAAGDPQALELFRSALSRDPEAIGAARGLSRIAERLDDPALLGEAAEREARVLLDVGRAASGLVQAGERLFSRGDPARAIQAFARALEIDPDHEVASARLSEVLLARNEVEQLLAYLTRAAGAAKKPDRVAALWAAVADLHATRKKDLAAAVAVLQRAHSLHPRHVPILLKLAELHANNGQWSEAVERLRQALTGKPDAQVAVEANFRLAAIFDEHLGDTARALLHVEAALALDPNHRAGLERLALIQLRRGQNDQAADTAARLVRMSPEIGSRVSALTLLGRVEQKRNQFEAAAHAYEQAVAVVGVEGSAAHEFRELVSKPRGGEGPTFARYVGALVRHIESLQAAASPAAFIEVARALGDEMGQSEQAVTWLERGLSLQPANVELRAALAERLLRSGQHQRALGELERVVALDVNREQAWRQLAEALQFLHRAGDGSVSVAPLVALGFANDLERSTYSMRSPRVAVGAPGSFGNNEMKAIAVRPGEDRAAELIESLGDISGKLYPHEVERWGVSSRERLHAKSGHPLRVLGDRVAQVFGLSEYDLYIHRAHNGIVELELTDPVSVLVPIHVTGLSEPEQAFLLGRAMAVAARGLAPVERLAPPALGILLAAGARLVEPNFAAGQYDEEPLANQARKLGRALPWLGRGPIEEAARAYAQAPERDVSEWALAVRMTAARAALIVADDLPSAVALVRKLEGDLSGADAALRAPGLRIAHDLIGFWVSEAAFVLRRRLGLG
jgi:tetratricopeptide (TPR) repeat protein